ncbi:MAG: OmpA family protein [Acidobacteriota bacterium]
MVATRRMAEEKDEMAKQAAIQAEARRRQAAEEARVRAEAQKQVAQQKQVAAEIAKADAEIQARKAQAEREAADRAKEEALKAEREAQAQQLQAEAEAIRAKATADEEARQRLKAETERAELRSKLLSQFNEILPTRETERGLVVNIGDVLFDLNQYTLRDEARQKLARFAGILLNYPDLRVRCEGHTDSTGTADYNQTLSEKRAQAASDYLSSLGIGRERLGYEGLGENEPVANNDTQSGRQRNRRVEMIVSGEVIGVPVSSSIGGGAQK